MVVGEHPGPNGQVFYRATPGKVTATGPGTCAPAVTLVVGSDVPGAMGPDFVPFSDGDDAEAFRADNGGEPVAFDEVTPSTPGR